jgi:hypothetical protein
LHSVVVTPRKRDITNAVEAWWADSLLYMSGSSTCYRRLLLQVTPLTRSFLCLQPVLTSSVQSVMSVHSEPYQLPLLIPYLDLLYSVLTFGTISSTGITLFTANS